MIDDEIIKIIRDRIQFNFIYTAPIHIERHLMTLDIYSQSL